MNTISPVKVWRNQKKIASLVGKIGVVESFTIVYVSPVGFENQAPYPVALARFGKVPTQRSGSRTPDVSDRDVGEKITAQIVDCDIKEVAIGRPVEVVLRRVKHSDREGVIPYGAKFKLISQ